MERVKSPIIDVLAKSVVTSVVAQCRIEGITDGEKIQERISDAAKTAENELPTIIQKIETEMRDTRRRNRKNQRPQGAKK